VHAIHDQVLRFISTPSDSFDELAQAVFTHQFDTIEPYRRFCERRGFTPSATRSWREIPPVPVSAFKEGDLACGPPERTFLSTGTTRGKQGRARHLMPDLRLYHAAAVAGMRRFLFPDVTRISLLSLVSPVAATPDSSLSQMVDWAIEEVGGVKVALGTTTDGIDYNGCVAALRASESTGEPICMMATTAGLIHFLDHCSARSLTFRLPHGSRLMDTGGSKGTPRPISRKGILQACWKTFAIPGYFCVNEYGMTELSSQFYENVITNRVHGVFAHRALVGPPWTRVRFLDPTTLAEVPRGERGLVCVYDLANVATAFALLTEDIGRELKEGPGFELYGRVTDAEARGCSLSAAEWQRPELHPAVVDPD
jgi:hypothetical protein